MAEACRALAFPVVSGNVSLYNETNGVAIPPTPAIGAIGLIPDLARQATIALEPGQTIILVGGEGGHLGQSLYQMVATGGFAGAPPPVDLDRGAAARRLRPGADSARRCAPPSHDISDGGLLVALGEMALAGGTGFTLYGRSRRRAAARALFRRGPGPLFAGHFARRMPMLSVERAQRAGVAARIVGDAGGDRIVAPRRGARCRSTRLRAGARGLVPPRSSERLFAKIGETHFAICRGRRPAHADERTRRSKI